MDNKSDEKFIIMESTIENNKQYMKADMKYNKQESDDKIMQFKSKMKANKQDSDEKIMLFIETLKVLTAFMMDPTNNYKYSPTQKDTWTTLEPITLVPTNRRTPPLEGGHYTNIGDMRTLNHDISSQKFYELLIRPELKGDTVQYIKSLYNHINMRLNAVTRLR